MKVNQLKKRFKILTIVFLACNLLACSNESRYKERISVADTAVTEKFEALETSSKELSLSKDVTANTIPNNLKIIKSAQAKYKVVDVKKVTNLIKQAAAKNQAYISDLRFENNLYKKENRFTIKIPAQYFDVMMDSISSFVEFVDYENITTQDVTEEYIDIQTRLKTKLEVKERYEHILRKNAKTVEDILLTEDKLRIIQEEIEAAQGRLKYLTSKVSYSTIQIDLYETVNYMKEPVSYQKTFGAKIKNGFSFGFKIIEYVFIGVIYMWPLLLILFSALFFVKMKKRKNV